MGGGGLHVAAAGVEFEAKITPIVIISCIMAATGGLMFGYDVGVSGKYCRATLTYVRIFFFYSPLNRSNNFCDVQVE